MKKLFLIIFFILLIITIIFLILLFLKPNNAQPEPSADQPETISTINSVEYNGWLQVSGIKLKNEKGQLYQLRGVSSHLLDEFGDLITIDNLKTLKEDWNTNVFRIAMYTDCYGSGYIYSPEKTTKKVTDIIDMATDLDMYVIIDWHILADNNPQQYEQQSNEFFNTISEKYSNTPNLIYEICNEPNGTTNWTDNIKPYAENIVKTIRNNSPKSLIIVGTPYWCTMPDTVIDSPLSFDNILYSCHFYSGTHGKELRDTIEKCLDNNIPIIISECGTTDSTGNGKLYLEQFDEWISFIDTHNLSWINWSFSNKDEGSAILTPDYKIDNSENNIDNYLSESGNYIKEILQSYKK